LNDYVNGMLREMELRADRAGERPTVPTLYLGGGTPSLLDAGQVGRLIDGTAKWFDLEGGAEITLEANPGTLAPESLAGYRQAGVNRLSIGIQSFNDRLLSVLGRIHSADEARNSFALARKAGFDNVGIDLIHGLPGQTLSMWEEELRQAVALAPEHISAYGLSIEEGTPLYAWERAGQLALPEEESAVRMFELTTELLAAAGYEQYEISNFARAGCRSRHNQVYWRRENYFGFGAGAHSFLGNSAGGVRWHNTNDIASYLQLLAVGTLPEEERHELSRSVAMGEFLFLGLRLLEGVEIARFNAEFGTSPLAAYPEVIPQLLEEGLLEMDNGRIRLGSRAILLSNQVFMRFL